MRTTRVTVTVPATITLEGQVEHDDDQDAAAAAEAAVLASKYPTNEEPVMTGAWPELLGSKVEVRIASGSIAVQVHDA